MILSCFVLWGCGSRQREVDGRAKKIILIVVDTLRADALGCYGYNRPTTPATDDLARQGVLFLQARAQSPWTLPSLATLLTGLYPRQHGALRSGVDFYALPEEAVTVAEILSDHGYATCAYVNTQFGFEPYQIDQGFETYSVAKGTRNSQIRDASATVKLAVEWLGQKSQGDFFLFVHLFDPHLKYEAPESFRSRWVRDPSYHGKFSETWGVFEDLEEIRTGNVRPRRADKEHLRDLYDAEIAYTDFAVGTLVKATEDLGIRDETLIIFTADHGEEFWDHGGFEHGHSFYDEVMRIPLIISWPSHLPMDVTSEASVAQIDVFATILEAAGVEIPSDVPGASLLRLDETEWAERIVIGEAPLAGRAAFGFVWQREKLMVFVDGETVLTRPWEDPREVRNHATTDSKRIADFHQRLLHLDTELTRGSLRRTKVEQEPIELDEEHHETLLHQGYLR